MDATFERLGFARDETSADRSTGTAPAAGAPDAAAIPSALPAALVIDARAAGSLALPEGDFALDAEWVREGGDLLMVGADGRTVTLAGYYDGAVPDLVTDSGSVLSPGLVAAIARNVAASAGTGVPDLAPDGAETAVAATSSGPGIDAALQVAQLGGTAAAIGKVEEVKGTATSRGGTGSGSGRLNVGDPIYQNDVIETSGSGSVTLRFNDTTKFTVGQNARMTLDKFVYDPGSGAGEMSVSVVKGVFRFVSGKVAHSAEDAMQVKLPVGTIGVRGTHVVGQADANGPNTRVTLLENPTGATGRIAVSNAGGTQVLSYANGSTQIAGARSAPGAERIASLAELRGFYGAATLGALFAGDRFRADDGDRRDAVIKPPDPPPVQFKPAEKRDVDKRGIANQREETIAQKVAEGGRNNDQGAGESQADKEKAETEDESSLVGGDDAEGEDPLGELLAAVDEILGDDSFQLSDEDLDILLAFLFGDDDTLQFGSEGDDVLQGTDGDDQLFGAGGDDLLIGFGGDDQLYGGFGQDTLFGGAGSDDLFGGLGDDRLVGGPGSDLLFGDYGDIDLADYSFESGGNGVLVDLANFTATDTFGTEDFLLGVAGAIGTDQADTMLGGAPAGTVKEVVFVGGAGNDVIDGAGSPTTVDYGIEVEELGGLQGVLVNLADDGEGGGQMAIDSFGDQDELYNVTGAIGTSFDDTLVGGDAMSTLAAGAGDDQVEAGYGGAQMAGGAGSDTMQGSIGVDIIDYGRETAREGGFQGVQVTLASGTAVDSFGDTDTFSGIEGVIGTSFDDVLDATGTGAAILTGGGGDDTMIGGAGIDTVNYAPESAYALEALGDYYGYYYYYAYGYPGVVVDLASGFAIDSSGGQDSLSGIENVQGSLGSDILIGDSGDNALAGMGGNDTLEGGAGNDTLTGAQFDVDVASYASSAAGVHVDISSNTFLYGDAAGDSGSGLSGLIGSDFADTLLGGAASYFGYYEGGDGDDSIGGGGGLDTLDGGAGNDTIVLESGVIADGGDDDDAFLIDSTFVLGSGFVFGGDGNDTLTVSGNLTLADFTGNALYGVFGIGQATSIGTVDLTATGAQTFAINPTNAYSLADGGELVVTGTAVDTLALAGGGWSLTGDNITVGNMTVDRYESGIASIIVDSTMTVEILPAPLTGTIFDDEILGTSASDEIDGLTGDDTIEGAAGGDTIEGGFGFDVVAYEGSSSGVSVDLQDGTVDGGDAAGDQIANIEGAIGSDFADTLVGGQSASDYFDGGDGDDMIDGADGNDGIFGGFDQLYGGAGNDTMVVYASDAVYGGTGDDVAELHVRETVDGTAPTTVDGGTGNDTLVLTINVDLADFTAFPTGLFTSIETIDMTAGVNQTLVLDDASVSDMADGSTLSVLGTAGDVVVLAGSWSSTGTNGSFIVYENGVDVVQVDANVSVTFQASATAGDDNLLGSAAGDVVDALAGNDTVDGQGGSDQILGNDGDDVLVGGAGDDSLDGGADIDTVDYSAASGAVGVDLANGTASDGEGTTDSIQLSSVERVVGSAFDDTIVADANDNTIEGGDGNDTLDGGAGADLIDGGNYTDMVDYSQSFAAVTVEVQAASATGGNATGDVIVNVEGVIGSAFDDVLRGDGGANSLYGGIGADTLAGGNDSDLLEGGSDGGTADYAALENLSASAGISVNLQNGNVFDDYGYADVLVNIHAVIGTSLADTMLGGSGNDTLMGGAGADSLQSTSSNSSGVTLMVGGAGADTFTGASGDGVIAYALEGGGSGVTVNMQSGVAIDTFGSTDALVNIDAVLGTSQTDVFIGNATGQNGASGLAGNDVLIGNGGGMEADYAVDVRLFGGFQGVTVNLANGTAIDAFGDTDTLVGITHARGTTLVDVLTGSASDDRLDGDLGADFIDGGAGNDTVSFEHFLQPLSNVGATVNLSLGQATDLGGSADTLVSIENVDGSDADDTIAGGSGTNLLMGSNGTDSIDGAGGDDWLQGGAGPDSMDGGLGNDTADYGQSSALVGVDLANGVATGGEASGDVLANIENVQGSDFNDLLRGDAQANMLFGSGGGDTLSGGLGADTLDGGGGDDVLHLETSVDPNDRFYGGNGTDGLVLDAGSVDLDLTALSNGALQGIERFDLTNGAHTLTLDASDVLNGSTAVNASAGNPSYLTWVVDASSSDGDVVELVNGNGTWAANGSFGAYDVYEHAGMGAKVMVDANVTVSVI